MKKLIISSFKYISLAIIFLLGFIIAPFVFNDFSFSYFYRVNFWVGISPLIILIPILFFALLKSDK
ncbi:hypothetical protein K5V21_09200 [Clostridium sardiniense]|uniref:DUF3955 domain-containing protein n=1 Tax=Clostridium sardiniense TaxID=29369 RepID=A0ABS7KXU9_CLOSR|nr:hypothetical protein [Clostridium sardiniense]MBM7836656.1 multisubunit Na+/H+ antiporter MnhE subunit [Clostridium sardiniense]MBY0755636.1 hypothetical protein [Clostridium sardiniense]MDQ0461806.1 multisubunit Na+/H+ antiporter MnhE subunit [Clostridium sardiniense]